MRQYRRNSSKPNGSLRRSRSSQKRLSLKELRFNSKITLRIIAGITIKSTNIA